MRALLAAVFLFACGSAHSAQLRREEVPAPLAPWVDWVLQGHEESLCPSLIAQEARPCVWPGALTLGISEKGGRFEQQIRLYAPGWAALPGDASKWPQGVRVDGQPAAVIARGEVPSVRLKPGQHSLSGSFAWDSTPELLQVPPETGLLSVTALGKSVPFPVRDEMGRLWLQRAQTEAPEAAGLDVAVHRHVVDEIPLELETQVQLRVSGKNREVLLGRALPKDFVPMSLLSPLPAKIDPDGRLRVQVRAGTWTMTVVARRPGPVASIELQDAGGHWDPDEVWVFEARNHLRVATVEGVPSIDPQQTELPGEWRRFPAYLMKSGDALRLTERRRGDQDPEPDRLTLNRTFWLDFDGRGLTVQDALQGTLRRSWRLDMGEDTKLGRVAVGGQDQFITATATGTPAGIELREGQVSLSADSRIERRRWSVPAVSWRHDFDQVSARLNLPPGWRLIHAGGADSASPTWVRTWTLLDLFLVLVLASAISKLWGPRWGIVALAAAGLAWHEPGAPRWLWLAAAALEALKRALSAEGLAAVWVRRVRTLIVGALAIFLVRFSVTQVRVGMYPQLGQAHGAGFGGVAPMGRGFGQLAAVRGAASGGAGGAEQDVAAVEESEPMDEGASDNAPAASAPMASEAKDNKALYRSDYLMPGTPKPKRGSYYQRAKNMLLIDPNSIVSTGPGLPDWNWSSVQLTWRGPVDARHRLRFWLIGPCGNFILALLRVALALGLALLLAGLPIEDWLNRYRRSGELGAAVKALLAALLLFVVPAAARGEVAIPNKEILEELRTRLLEPPDCAPDCAEIGRVAIEGSGAELRIRLDVQAAAASGVPIPGNPKEWMPARAWLDGAATGVHRSSEGTLWIAVGPGAHQLMLDGPLPPRDSVQISFPVKPRRGQGSVGGWLLSGLGEDGAMEETLQLSRDQGGKSSLSPTASGNFPPFVRVERTLRLGLSWEVYSRVLRLTPAGAPVSLELPLLPGESVTTAELRVKNGKLLVTLPPQAMELAWTSTLAEAANIVLKAPASASWVEEWGLEASPIWHAEAAGIPPVHQEPGGGQRTLRWRPWPGESVELSFARPKGVPGQSLTIDRTEMTVSPGLRATDVSLSLGARASRGGQHPVTLPEGAELLSARIDGRVEPVRQEGRRVVLQLEPGSHAAELTWRQPGGVRAWLRTPAVDAGASSVNARIHLAMPADRWTLFAGGPRLGPAVLFWSLLAVFFLVSVGLGRVALGPLGWRQWFLLSLGLTQVSLVASGIVVAWFLAMGLRQKRPLSGPREFDLYQCFLVFLTLVAAACLFRSISHGLLGLPDMQIAGNGSYAQRLEWYQDRASSELPRAWVFSVPLGVYRLSMLGWALWLAGSLMGWVRWAWGCFGTEGLWKPLRPAVLPAK